MSSPAVGRAWGPHCTQAQKVGSDRFRDGAEMMGRSAEGNMGVKWLPEASGEGL